MTSDNTNRSQFTINNSYPLDYTTFFSSTRYCQTHRCLLKWSGLQSCRVAKLKCWEPTCPT